MIEELKKYIHDRIKEHERHVHKFHSLQSSVRKLECESILKKIERMEQDEKEVA